MIRAWLESTPPKNEDEAIQALREIMQEVALAGHNLLVFAERHVLIPLSPICPEHPSQAVGYRLVSIMT